MDQLQVRHDCSYPVTNSAQHCLLQDALRSFCIGNISVVTCRWMLHAFGVEQRVCFCADGSGGVSTADSAAGGPASESAGSDEAGGVGSGDDGAGDGETSSTRDVSGEEPDSDVITSEPSVAFNHLSAFTAAWAGLGGTLGVLLVRGVW